MLDIPVGKAIVPVEVNVDTKSCKGCYMRKKSKCLKYRFLECNPYIRKDGKNVIFKLVDYEVD